MYLILLGLGVPALTFSGLWFGRLRYQRHAGGRLTETEIAARIAARQEELRRQGEAQDEHLAGLLPQRAILTVSAYAAVAAVVVAHYGDGVIRPRALILAGQAPVTLVFALHTAAVVEMHARLTTAEVLQATLATMDTEAERLRPPGPSSR